MTLPDVNSGRVRALKAEQADERHARDQAFGGGRSTDEALKSDALLASVEVAEGRPEWEGNSVEPITVGTQNPVAVLSGIDRIRAVAKRNKKERFTSLMHHMTVEMLLDSYWAMNPKASAGVDAVTWGEYGEDLRTRVTGLHERVQAGTYRALPSRRVWIPKADGRQRPLGVAALEDKIVQTATTWILNAIYEEDFAGFSYGFRPGRGTTNALDALYIAINDKPINWVLDADIKGFFDTLDHTWMMKFLEHRIADKRMLRLIQKWLRCGVCDNGVWTGTQVGTPQGAVISPLLANIYLHYCLDLWTDWWRRTKAKGEVIIVRYADDFIIGFQHHGDATAFLELLQERMRKFALELHPEKTKLIEFGKVAIATCKRSSKAKPETFNFLGFTHSCGVRHGDRRFAILRRTISKRLHAKIASISKMLDINRSKPIKEQGTWLRSVVTGWMNYHAIPTNSEAVHRFRELIVSAWRKALRRRSQKARALTWEKMRTIASHWIPKAKILHDYPNRHNLVTT